MLRINCQARSLAQGRKRCYESIINFFRSFLKLPILIVVVIECSRRFQEATPVNLINFVADMVFVKGVRS
jgi:hypothetical protein